MGKTKESVFKGLQNARVFERGAYLAAPGDYLLEINKCIVKETRKSGDGFIVEFTVKESNNDQSPVGTKATWFQSLKDKDIAHGAIKEFMYAVLGFVYSEDREEIEKSIDPKIEGLVEEAVDEEKNSLAGEHVRVQTSMKKTQAKQVDFTVHMWRPATSKAA